MALMKTAPLGGRLPCASDFRCLCSLQQQVSCMLWYYFWDSAPYWRALFLCVSNFARVAAAPFGALELRYVKGSGGAVQMQRLDGTTTGKTSAKMTETLPAFPRLRTS